MSGDVLASDFRRRPLCWIHMSSSTAGAELGPRAPSTDPHDPLPGSGWQLRPRAGPLLPSPALSLSGSGTTLSGTR